MPELPDVQKRHNSNLNDPTLEVDALRILSRSPHPYHHNRSELLHSSDRLGGAISSQSILRGAHDTDGEDDFGIYSRHTSPRTTSDSGTEADDEHFLKGLPAPRLRLHKGLRGQDGTASATSSPLISPLILNEGEEKVLTKRKKASPIADQLYEDPLKASEKIRRKRRVEISRRLTEILLLGMVCAIVLSSNLVRLVLWCWKRELLIQFLIFAGLTILYPLRLISRSNHGDNRQQWHPFSIPAEFDPAPLLYPPWLTMLVAALLSPANTDVILPNILLGIASLPSELIPTISDPASCYNLHWLISCVPLFTTKHKFQLLQDTSVSDNYNNVLVENLQPEMLVLLYPLHRALCVALHYLTTTSLLRAELQLLSISLINVLLLSSSPQAIILKALLWGGGVGMFILCGNVLKWVVTLARVPKWRFRRASNLGRYSGSSLGKSKKHVSLISGFKGFKGFNGVWSRGDIESDDDNFIPFVARRHRPTDLKINLENMNGNISANTNESTSAVEARDGYGLVPRNTILGNSTNISRRYTLPLISPPIIGSSKQKQSGKRKRTASSSLQSFFLLTERQATVRKWLYAGWVYVCVLGIILAGIRPYIGNYALEGSEPIGWALGYVFGNLAEFRMMIVTANLERWVRLPDWITLDEKESCRLGWVERLRHSTFGPANTRLILCAYWLAVIVVGLAVVFRLSAIYEVDTRRKVFHFMMVAMLLPATYVDPTFAALALTLVLAIFLLLDLFRASQLPPLSKPLASFLTPYVDGRDLRGPVVISHIFLLIGCAIPLWLSLGALGRTGSGCWAGWDVPTRDVSMVAGVICVGMGDAAASLIGRRFGRHKWFWVGGKSLEGSVAFATAVSSALCLAKVWLRIGGWTSSNDVEDLWTTTAWKAGLAASVASLTEAVLTGGNDNVVVPVVLWLCVKGLRI